MVPSARQTREGWDLLIASTVRLAPQGLLSLRYIDGLLLWISTGDDWESGRNKVAAGMNPAAIAALVAG
jgi:hypothetical protein